MIKKERKRILLLPTYWPTKEAPIVGSQVKEQSELMLNDFDIRVIYNLPGMGWKRFVFYSLTNLFLRKKKYYSCDDELISGSLMAIGNYYYNSQYFPKWLNAKIKQQSYTESFNRFIMMGRKPDLIHSRTAEHTGYQAALLSKKFNIPNLLTENCIFILDNSIKIKQIQDYRYAIESANKVAVVSHYLKAFLLSHNYKCDPTIIGNMVDESFFTLKDNFKRNQTTTIFTAAHLGFTKDWSTFFKVINDLINIKEFKNIKVIIAVTQIYGEDSRKIIPNLAKEYNVDKYCDIRFQVSRNEVVKLFQIADIFLSTSLNETFGIATLEAMACGTPVVATRNGGIEDFIDKDNGILCNIGDYNALANAVEDIINGKIKFDSNKVRDSVVSTYGKKAFTQKLKELYLKTINENN